jgi:peptidoglycan hydrolase-like protein with peptidoglycan-binding domain
MKKIISISTGLALALVATVIFSAPSAQAATNITVSPNLTIGSTGDSVVVLQALMSEMGYLNVPAGVPFGYYGSLTKNAVASYQASLNVSPAVGYYGPVTKTALYSDFNNRGWLRLLCWSF